MKVKINAAAYRQAEVMKIMRSNPRKNWSAYSIARKWSLSGGAKNARGALWELFKKGMVEHPSYGVWTVPARSATESRHKPAR